MYVYSLKTRRRLWSIKNKPFGTEINTDITLEDRAGNVRYVQLGQKLSGPDVVGNVSI